MGYIKIVQCSEIHTQTLSTGKVIQHTIASTLECSHPDVEKIWSWGSIGPIPGGPVCYYLSLIMKDGIRAEFEFYEDIHEAIEKAEDFLNNLNKINHAKNKFGN